MSRGTGETGWTEVDTVTHCGGKMGGDFIRTLTGVEKSKPRLLRCAAAGAVYSPLPSRRAWQGRLDGAWR